MSDFSSMLRFRVVSNRLIGQVGWVTGSYAYAQITRLITSIVLARLLAPNLLGLMLIINTLRTGVELLSDIGIGQSIVSNPRGAELTFFNTSWTLQILRGLFLAATFLIIAFPVSRYYDNPTLSAVLPFVAILFVLTGLQSPAHFLLQKAGNVRKYALFEISVNSASSIFNIVLAVIYPSIWALISGLLLSTLASTVMSFFLVDWRVHRLRLDQSVIREISGFGRWVFVSSLVYFLATNFDKMYFSKAIPVALLGVYGVARTFADAGTMLVTRVGNLLIFPKIAALSYTNTSLRDAIDAPRSVALRVVALGLSLAIAGSDRVVYLLYDDRYRLAGTMLPILLVGVWFAVLSAIGDSILLGTRNPARAAAANAMKLVWTVVALPVALYYFGLVGAVVVLSSSEFVRYVAISVFQGSGGTSFIRSDAVTTLMLVVLALMWRALFAAAGLVPTLHQFHHIGPG